MIWGGSVFNALSLLAPYNQYSHSQPPRMTVLTFVARTQHLYTHARKEGRTVKWLPPGTQHFPVFSM